MRITRISGIIPTVIFYISVCSAQDTIRMSDYGIIPGKMSDASKLVNFVINGYRDCENTVFLFEKGRYDFFRNGALMRDYYESNTTVVNPRACSVIMEKLHNIVIDGGGSEFIFHGRVQPFAIDSCSGITIRNVTLDWDHPMGAEAVVTGVTPEYVTINIDTASYQFDIIDGKLLFRGEIPGEEPEGRDLRSIMEFDSKTLGIAPGTGDSPCLGEGWDNYTAEYTGEGNIRLKYRFKRLPEKGNYLVFRLGERDHAGVFINNSRDIDIEHLNIYSSCGLGLLAQFSDNVSFRSVRCVPNPEKRKVLSLHDDGLHISNCSGMISADSCVFKGLMDDSFNAHGTAVKVIRKSDTNSLVCRYMHPQSVGFIWAVPGDTVSVIRSRTMNSIGRLEVERFMLFDRDSFEIAFRSALPDFRKEDYALENLSNTPDVTIRHCYFGNHRARGVLVSTPGKVIIEDNIFESSGSAILIAGDANYWYETGAVRDVTIRSNYFGESCLTSMYQFCEAIISICPEIPETSLWTGMRAKKYHSNITITGNTFLPFDYPVLYARSTDSITFNRNTVVRSDRYTAFHPRHNMLTFEDCSNIKVINNRIEKDVRGRNVRLEGARIKELTLEPPESIKLSNWTFRAFYKDVIFRIARWLE